MSLSLYAFHVKSFEIGTSGVAHLRPNIVCMKREPLLATTFKGYCSGTALS